MRLKQVDKKAYFMNNERNSIRLSGCWTQPNQIIDLLKDNRCLIYTF